MIGRSRATHHRALHPGPVMLGPWPKTHHPAELTAAERLTIIDLLNSPEYQDRSPMQVWVKELDLGRYHCAPRTMYRILAEYGLLKERRNHASHPPRVIPELVALKPDDVWSWDITKLRGHAKGIWYHAYVILDIFARYVVGQRIENKEDGELAKELVELIVHSNDRKPGYLHADGGAAMTSKELSSLLLDLNIIRTHNRPHTSNDNPYSESQFKTTKYHPEYPQWFASIGDSRTWFNDFTTWYNWEHYHSGIGYHTPADVYFGTAPATREKRQATLDAAYAAKPHRFTKPPVAPPLPKRAAINDPTRRPKSTN